MSQERRSTKWIHEGLQAKAAAVTFAIAAATLAINFLACQVGIVTLARGADASTSRAVQNISSHLWAALALALAAGLPLSLWVGGSLFFKICGPLYRFRCYMEGLREGRWDDSCRLRKGDELHEVAAAINVGVRSIAGAVRRQAELLDETRSLLSDLESEHGDERCTLLRERITAELSAVENRFASRETSAQSAGTAAEASPVTASAMCEAP